jgi:hypothetical protein
MGLDELHLRVLATSSDEDTERRNAQKGKYSRDRCMLDAELTRGRSSSTHVQGPPLGLGGACFGGSTNRKSWI